MDTATAVKSLFATLLVAISAALMVWNARSWQAARALPEDSPERAFAWRQFRRRMQTSGMIAVLGLAMFVGQFVTSPLWIGPYWLGVLCLLGWVLLLALLDIGAIHKYYGSLRAEHRTQLAAMEARLRQLDPPSNPAPPAANQG
jgi:hypothetical protein